MNLPRVDAYIEGRILFLMLPKAIRPPVVDGKILPLPRKKLQAEELRGVADHESFVESTHQLLKSASLWISKMAGDPIMCKPDGPYRNEPWMLLHLSLSPLRQSGPLRVFAKSRQCDVEGIARHCKCTYELCTSNSQGGPSSHPSGRVPSCHAKWGGHDAVTSLQGPRNMPWHGTTTLKTLNPGSIN